MATKKKLEYPEIPQSIQDITKKYIKTYVLFETKNGNISRETLEKWIGEVEAAEKKEEAGEISRAFDEYKRAFVKLFFPQLLVKNDDKASDYFKALLK